MLFLSRLLVTPPFIMNSCQLKGVDLPLSSGQDEGSFTSSHIPPSVAVLLHCMTHFN